MPVGEKQTVTTSFYVEVRTLFDERFRTKSTQSAFPLHRFRLWRLCFSSFPQSAGCTCERFINLACFLSLSSFFLPISLQPVLNLSPLSIFLRNKVLLCWVLSIFRGLSSFHVYANANMSHFLQGYFLLLQNFKAGARGLCFYPLNVSVMLFLCLSSKGTAAMDWGKTAGV